MIDCTLCLKSVDADTAPIIVPDAEHAHDLCIVCGKHRGEIEDEKRRQSMLADVRGDP